jgi:hypothetical protein
VASKQVFPFDFTVGLGNGRFGAHPLEASGDGVEMELFTDPKKWWDDAHVFAGIQFAPSERFALMVEYAPIRYEDMSLYDVSGKEIHFDGPVPSKVNYGLRLRPVDWAEVDLSWQRGEQFGMNVALDFALGRPLIPIYDAPYREEPALKMSPAEERVATALAASGFSDIAVLMDGDELRIEAANERWFFAPKAVALAMRLADRTAPETVRRVSVTLTENRTPVLRFRALRSDIGEWRSERLSNAQFAYLSGLDADVYENLHAARTNRSSLKYGLMPVMQTTERPLRILQGPHRPAGVGERAPLEGIVVRGRARGLPGEQHLNGQRAAVHPGAQRHRPVQGAGRGARQAPGRPGGQGPVRAARQGRGRAAGAHVRGLRRGDGRAGHGRQVPVGISGSAVKNGPRGAAGPEGRRREGLVHHGLRNVRLNVPEWDLWFDLKAGRFLAGDAGARIAATKFINGLTVSAWYGMTNTSVFSDDTNEGYRDTGFTVSIPLRLFKGADSRSAYRYTLAPWTRDVAQDIAHYNSLFDLIGRNTGVAFREDAGEM